MIQQCGAGLEGVDIAAAAERGITVANVPTGISGNAASVAELGIYLMIGLYRNVHGMVRSLNNRKMGQPPGRALTGQTVGLDGIGQALIKRLRGFSVYVLSESKTTIRQRQKRPLAWIGRGMVTSCHYC